MEQPVYKMAAPADKDDWGVIMRWLTYLNILLASLPMSCAHTGPPVYTREEQKMVRELDQEAQKHQAYLRTHPQADLQNFHYHDAWMAAQNERLKRIAAKICAANQFEIPSLNVEPGIYQRPFEKDIRIINAATDGRQIIVTAAMMKLLEEDDELAAVVGHELAHIHQGHISRRILRNLPLVVLGVVADNQTPGTGDSVMQIGGIFLSEFDRDEEREADVYGVTYIKRAGFNYRKAPNVWRKMAIQQPENIQEGLYFGHSHPFSPERLIRLQKVVKDLERGQDPIQKYLPKEDED